MAIYDTRLRYSLGQLQVQALIEEQTLLDNRYRILGPLGSGGMSEVYLCRDELLDREVALKLLRQQYASDEEFVERFVQEARSAASLQHPNIASVYDLGRSRDGRYYIVMEYVRGGTLSEYLARRGPLSAQTAAAVAEQIASALAAAHDEGLTHRDVKPQNVLITAEGDVKLADFGIARAVANTSVSQTGHVLGTASYMSPEQALGERTTLRSDLYSLGGVLYEMLIGEVPFEADTPVAVSLKHVGEHPHHPVELNPEVPEEMDAVVMRLLAKDPAERYESAGKLAEDLGRIQEGLPPVRAAANAAVPVSAVGFPFGGEVSSAAPVSATGGGHGAGEALPAATPGEKRPWRRRCRKLLLSVAPLAVVALLAALLAGLSRDSSEGEVIGSLEEAPGNAFGEMRGVFEDAEQAVLGPREATIPEVEGLPEEQARQRLEERGFEAESRSRQSSEGDAGVVLEQSAPGGEQAEEGSMILLAVGEGPGGAAAGPAGGSGGPGGQASLPDPTGAAGGSADANAGGGGSDNGADNGSSGLSEGSGDYIVPPSTDEDEAGPGSASAPLGPPETDAPARTPSQPSPAPPSPVPAPPPDPWQAPASSSSPEAVPEPSYPEGPAEPAAEPPVATEEPPVPEETYPGSAPSVAPSAQPGGENSGDDGTGDPPPGDPGAEDDPGEAPSETYPSNGDPPIIGGSNGEEGTDGVLVPPLTPFPTEEIPDPVDEQYSSEQYSSRDASQSVPAAP